MQQTSLSLQHENTPMRKKILRQLLSYFIQGLLLLTPALATFYAIYVMFIWMDSRTNQLVELIVGYRIPGLGILMMVILVTLMGMIGSTIIFRPILAFIGELLERTPLVKVIYTSLKDLMGAFMSNKKKFNKPVLVHLNSDQSVSRLGFITQEDLSELHIQDRVAVYLPHSYNISGNLYVVKRSQIEPISPASAAELMKFIVSGGVTELED